MGVGEPEATVPDIVIGRLITKYLELFAVDLNLILKVTVPDRAVPDKLGNTNVDTPLLDELMSLEVYVVVPSVNIA